jgi:ABC-type lipoprotein export system ATPase subunit
MAAVMAVMEADRPLHIEVARKVFPAVGGRDELAVLRNVSFTVEPRSFVVLTGPSGCGKSTLLNIVAGLDQDYEGRIDLGSRAPRVAFIFQTPRLLPWRTIRENIALPLPSGDPRHARIDDMLARVGLTQAAHAYPERTSLGMQRRAALARGFILEPDILFMDEPFVSLDDPTNRIHPGLFPYGGAHVIEDLVAGRDVLLSASAYGTDCYPRRRLDTLLNISGLNEAVLFNIRNCYQNYNCAVNLSDKIIYTYMGVLKPGLGN